jgi:hypothetical protein
MYTFRKVGWFKKSQAGDGVHTCNPNTQEAEPEGLQVWGQPGLYMRPCLKKKCKIK